MIPETTQRRRETPGARWLVAGALLLAVTLGFGVRGLLAGRVVQGRAVAMLKSGRPVEALEEADLRLSRQPDDPHLVNVASAAAKLHADTLARTLGPGSAAFWLEGQLARRPYLRKGLAGRLLDLKAAAGAQSGARSAPPQSRALP